MARSGLLAIPGSLTAGMAYGVPPIVQYGSKQLQEKFLPDLLTGKKRSCVAVTEAGAGSDVANVATTAQKSADGKSYIVNGDKKWYARHTQSQNKNLTHADPSLGLQMGFGQTTAQWLSEKEVQARPVYPYSLFL